MRLQNDKGPIILINFVILASIKNRFPWRHISWQACQVFADVVIHEQVFRSHEWTPLLWVPNIVLQHTVESTIFLMSLGERCGPWH